MSEKSKFADEFELKAVDKIEQELLEQNPTPDSVLSTDVLNRMKLANEKRSYDAMKQEVGGKKKKVEDPEEFKKREEDILKKLLSE